MKLTQIASNSTQITFKNGKQVLFSYETPVAANIGGRYYRTETKFSRTTSKHINNWLDGIQAEEKPQEFFEYVVNN
ncbi:MAG: hypothetical protein WBH12_08810 [Sediminibacterium sp.]|jgi:hypothetical protein